LFKNLAIKLKQHFDAVMLITDHRIKAYVVTSANGLLQQATRATRCFWTVAKLISTMSKLEHLQASSFSSGAAK
jgi:hypothetical protein